MKKLLLSISIIFSCFQVAYSVDDLLVVNVHQRSFDKAYQLNPSIPKGVLEAVAFTQTRFKHIDANVEASCMGYPKTSGVMGLVENGENYFRNNLVYVSQLSGYSANEIKTNPEKSILAYAKAFATLQNQLSIYGNNLVDYIPIFIALSELPLSDDLQNDYALNSHLYQLYWFLSESQFQNFYNFPNYQLSLPTIFGSNYQVLSASSVVIGPNSISNSSGTSYLLSGAGNTVASPDYPPAIWNPTICNYSSRNGVAISAVAIHFVQGSYAGCISWFKNCSANASAHYVIRSSDGQVTQMVYESDKAWHIGSENPYTLGTEHEGYIDNISWFTTAMYQSSADLTRDMCTSNNINPLRCYYGPSCSGTTAQCLIGNCTKIKGHQMFPNQTHTDPGPNWNWERFYKLINNSQTVTTVTTTSGNFYDSGGPSANYTNDERKLWLFQPTGVTSISMNFSSFSLENNYDFLFLYDGSSVNSPLIGKYTNTVSPGNVNSSGTTLLAEFRSDCATTSPGWVATYTSNAVPTNTVDNVIPTTQVSTTGAWQTANFTSAFSDADAGGSGLEKSYYQVIDFDGTEWRGNHTRGFFSDNFDAAIHPEWAAVKGIWGISNNALVQTDEVSADAANTNIYAALTQTLSNRYLYNFKGKLEGSGTNRRAGFHFFADNPNAENRGNSYFVWFRLDNQAVQIYKTSYTGTVNVFGSPTYTAPVSLTAGQWYDFKVIYDRISGKMDVYKDNSLIATWTDSSPLSSGTHISFRSGNCKWSLDEIKIYRSRPTASVTVLVGSGNANDARFQNPSPTQFACKVKSIVNDGAGNLSSIYYHDVNIDWTNPSNINTIRDGKTNSDINTVTTSDSLSANWSPSTDSNSGITRYWYSIGTSPGAVNTLTWTSAWSDTTITVRNLSLINGQVYYFNVRSENGAGLLSNVVSTNGQTVNISIPTAPTASVNSVNSICVGQPVALSDASSGGPTSWNWTMPGGTPSSATSQNISVTYTAAGVYTLSLLASNATGSNTAVSTITVLANPVLSVSASQSSLCAGQSSTLSASGASMFSWNPTTDLNTSSGASVVTTPSASIVYTVVGASGNCSSVSTLSLNVIPNPVVNASASIYTLCSGQSSTLSVSGASSYSWTPATYLSSTTGSLITSNPTSNTIYTVTGVSLGCEGVATISLAVNPNPVINVSSSQAQICVGETTTLTAGGASSYTWSPSSTLSSANGNIVIANPTVTTVYNISGNNGTCTGNGMFTLVVNTCTGIEQLSNTSGFNIYPNPFSNEINLVYYLAVDSEVEIMLIDMLGKEITHQTYQQLAGNHSNVLYVDDAISQGIYSLKIKIGKEEIYRKLIKQ